MTISQIAMICAGFSLNALTFVLGILVGLALSNRKDSTNGNGNEGTKADYWHKVGGK